ncbi:MAG: hypothetical protein Q4D42_04770 [Eubacteriales bacterium]|nr:hypothetical protein [Eubacteriales bacterium]
MIDKRTLCMVCAMGMMMGSMASAQAASTSHVIQDSEIPDSATPGAVLEYVSDGLWESVSVSQDMLDAMKNASDTEQTADAVDKNDTDMCMASELPTLSLEEEQALLEKVNQEVAGLPVYREELPEPVVGMHVMYDNWGEVENVYFENKDGTYSVVEPTLVQVNDAQNMADMRSASATRALAQGTRKPAGTYTYGKVVSETTSKVGYTTNTIQISSSNVFGTGDFTVFTDTIGDHDNTLKYGDCATKGSYDNPRYGTTIATRNMLNNVGSSFIKNDNGGLPNAVLDIWKTGVAKLGITSTNYSNIKFAGRYYYEF